MAHWKIQWKFFFFFVSYEKGAKIKVNALFVVIFLLRLIDVLLPLLKVFFVDVWQQHSSLHRIKGFFNVLTEIMKYIRIKLHFQQSGLLLILFKIFRPFFPKKALTLSFHFLNRTLQKSCSTSQPTTHKWKKY